MAGDLWCGLHFNKRCDALFYIGLSPFVFSHIFLM